MKTALITGATGTLGFALVKEFEPYCSRIITNGRDTKSLQMINDEHECCSYVSGDLRDPQVLESIHEWAVRHDVDVAVLNAGMILQKNFLDCREHELVAAVMTNLMSTMLLLHRLLPHFLNRKSGTIVVVNSAAGKHGNPNEVAYCASKFGLRGMVESLSQECAVKGVRLMGVYPGAIKSPVTGNRADHDKLLHPSDVAKFIADLCFTYTDLRLDEVEVKRTKY